MTIDNFNKLYADKGGYTEFVLMMEAAATLTQIGDYFGVTKARVAQWCKDMTGSNYDPRKFRKEHHICFLVENIKKFGLEETKSIFKNINGEYLKEAKKRFNDGNYQHEEQTQ